MAEKFLLKENGEKVSESRKKSMSMTILMPALKYRDGEIKSDSGTAASTGFFIHHGKRDTR